MQHEPYESMLTEYLKGEMRVINAHIPACQKTLSDLLKEDYPCVETKDGSAYIIKKKELNYLAGFLSEEEQKELVLPFLIEVVPGEDYTAVIARNEVVHKVIEHVLGMPVRYEKGRIVIVRPQLSVLRQNLRTATQYILSPKIST